MGTITHITAVVDEPRQIPALCGVNDGVLVNPEQVAAPYALLLVPLLPHVSDDLGQKKKKTGVTARYHHPASPQEPERVWGVWVTVLPV